MEFKDFYTMSPQKYYDCGGDYKKQNAQDMISNKDNLYLATQKNDGEWCRAIIDFDGKVTLQSRTISKVTGTYGDKTLHVPHLVEELKCFPNGTVFLGELCFDDITKTSKDVGTILRCLPPKAVQRQNGDNSKLVFKAFDCLSYNEFIRADQGYADRFNTLKNAIEYTTETFGLKYIKTTNFTLHNFEDFLQEILAQGGEGIVIHRKDYIYSPGSRTAWKTLKVKKIVEELELQVVDTIDPNKLHEGVNPTDTSWKYWELEDKVAGEKHLLSNYPCSDDYFPCDHMKLTAVTKPYALGWKNGVIVDNNGTKVRVTSGLTDEDREWLATNEAQQLIKDGKLFAQVTAMEVVADSGSLRHPRLVRLRTDIE